MMSIFRTFVLASTMLFTDILPVAAQTTDVSRENQSVNSAIEDAKKTLPKFFERLANPRAGDSGFLIKIRFDKGKGDQSSEYLWGKDVVRISDQVSATIDSDPRDIQTVKRNDRVTIPVSDISDWLYVRDGKYQGAYTVRALLPFMPKAQADDMRKRFPD